MKRQLSKVIGIMLSLFMLMQMTTAVFAATSELTWALAPTADKLVNLYGDRDVYTYGMGLCFQAADSGQYGVMEKNGTVIIPAEYEKVVYDGFSIANASRIKEAVSLSFWNWGENPDVYMDIEGN